MVACGLTVTGVSGIGTASAEVVATYSGLVNPNAPGWQEPEFQSTGPATAVYGIQDSNSGAAAVKQMLTVDGGSIANGAAVNTWGYSYTVPTGPLPGSDGPLSAAREDGGPTSILFSNQSWEFVPASDNTGGTIFTGYGWLRNRSSGKCLEVNGNNTADHATVDQWDCLAGADNELWKANPANGVGDYYIQVKFDGAVLGKSGSSVGDGVSVQALTTPFATGSSANSSTAYWKISKVSYAFATNQMYLPAHISPTQHDNAIYRCLPGYKVRVRSKEFYSAGPTDPGRWYVWYAFQNLSSRDVSAQAEGVFAPDQSDLAYREVWRPLGNPNSAIYYSIEDYANTNGGTGQMLLFCDPA